MNYATLRFSATTGDLILQAGTSLAARILRVFTASQYSHAGLLVRKEDTLWVAEMKLDTGYTLSPASTRLREMAESGVVRWGPAPDKLNRTAVEKRILYYRDGSPNRKKDPAYSLPAALIVWLAQWVQPLVPTKWTWVSSLLEEYARRQFVCSTFVQSVWEDGGIYLDKLADPEDLARQIETLTMLEFPKELTEK